jgi:hypothetical protein
VVATFYEGLKGLVKLHDEGVVGRSKLLRGLNAASELLVNGDRCSGGPATVLSSAAGPARGHPGIQILTAGEYSAFVSDAKGPTDGKTEPLLPALHGAYTLTHIPGDVLPAGEHGGFIC